MTDLTAFISFIVISIGFIAIPGPNVLIVISTSIDGGKSKGFLATLGVSFAMSIQLLIAATGTSILVNTLAEGFELFRWFGVAYLFYLAFGHFQGLISMETNDNRPGGLHSFGKGFFISLTNPKTVIFFSAFLPQFVLSAESYTSQIALLSFTFLLLAVLVNITYVLMASYFSTVFSSRLFDKIKHGTSGSLYLMAGSMLAVTKNN